MTPLVLAFFGIMLNFVGMYMTSQSNYEANQTQKDLQEDAQDFTNDQREEQNEWNLQQYENNLVNGPSLKRMGLENAGVSTAAAVQALTGASSIQQPIASSNNGSGIASAIPSPLGQMFQQFADSFNPYYDNLLKEAQANNIEKNTDWVDVLNQNIIDKAKVEMQKMRSDMFVSQKQVRLAEMLAQSQIGLNATASYKNLAEVEKIVEEAETERVSRNKLYGDGGYYDSMINTNNASAYESLQHGNLMGSEKVYQDFRNKIAIGLGVDIGSPVVSQIMQAISQGVAHPAFEMTKRAIQSVLRTSFDDAFRNSPLGRIRTKVGEYRDMYREYRLGSHPHYNPIGNYSSLGTYRSSIR